MNAAVFADLCDYTSSFFPTFDEFSPGPPSM